ncbi:MAG: hypothetical protein IJ099_02865 [Alphaproteobacteria bacterium]|nr:hypothetical protein [Alphaproteobacteria bacterium]
MNTKRFFYCVYQTIKTICGITGVLVICGLCYLWFDDEMSCLDIGEIYDPVQKICRDDCLTWNDEIGCVPITKENIEKKVKRLL